MGGVGCHQRRQDPIDVEPRVRDVHPEMRVLAAVLAGDVLHPRQVLTELDEGRAGGRGVGDRLLEPVVEAHAVHHEQLRGGDGPDVGRPGRERVHVAVRRNEARRGHEVAAHFLDHLGEDGRGRDDRQSTDRRRRRIRRPVPQPARRMATARPPDAQRISGETQSQMSVAISALAGFFDGEASQRGRPI